MEEFNDEEIILSNAAKLLSHPARVRILKLLTQYRSLSSNKLIKEIPLARTTVLQHISVLTKENWLKTNSDGTTITYFINTPLIKNILPLLEGLLSESGKSISIRKEPIKILFLCTGNSCRSQIAQGFINKYSKKNNIIAFSAGTNPSKEIHPIAVSVMNEIGIDISNQYPKSIKQYIGDESIDLVIFVCEKAEKECPYFFPFSKHRINMPFKDPASFTGDEKEKIKVFRDIRNQIEFKINKLLEEFPEL